MNIAPFTIYLDLIYLHVSCTHEECIKQRYSLQRKTSEKVSASLALVIIAHDLRYE